MRLFSHKNRPFHLGPYPLDRLARTQQAPSLPDGVTRQALQIEDRENHYSLANAMGDYVALFDRMRDGPAFADKAPIPEDLQVRAQNIKGGCYFLDISQVGICALSPEAILATPIRAELGQGQERQRNEGAKDNALFADQAAAAENAESEADNSLRGHTHAVVMLVEYTRDPQPGEPGYQWIKGTQPQRASVRAAEVAAVMASYIRVLGYDARAHTATCSDVNFDLLLLAAGLAEVTGSNGDSRLSNPYLGERFGLAVVTTNLELAVEQPLAERGLAEKIQDHGPGWLLGSDGAKPGWRGLVGENRPLHLGKYPMEKIKRVARPTTVVDAENIPRMPKRSNFFHRAAHGDLGKKPAEEMQHMRFSSKEPFGASLMSQLGGLIPLQYGKEADSQAPGTDDPQANADAVKALCYYMGGDLVGVGPAKPYTWYSHDHDGSPIEPYHKNAIVILTDQGYETMEGSSGDDWISGSQSMRAYLRGALMSGIVAEQIRRLGYSARTHTVVDEDVLHIPIILEAGLGEMSRIGELVLNPFVGPRFKSVVITTDMPLAADGPIDFGLQDFCGKCVKCARECPPQAIPYGDKLMFNGYESWKQDPMKCAKYRITNGGGAVCGRCMKTCPYNIEGVLAERPFLWAAINLPFSRKWLAKMDDKVGNGRRNPIKKWWFDLEIVDGKVGVAKRANARELNLGRKTTTDNQHIAVFPISLIPPPGEKGMFPVTREQGRKAREELEATETPAQAKARLNW